MTEIETLHASVDVAAPPERVWALVTDLPRMASWSPQVLRTVVRGPVRLGSHALNLNRRGLLVWPTRTTVVRFEPHRDFAFRVRDNGVVWSFGLAPTPDGGTTLTQRREAPEGITPISLFFQKHALGGVSTFTGELVEGMRQTLERIKADAEAA